MTPIRLLFVCTGNICRSPSAEYLLQARLDERLGPDAKAYQLGSAGLGTPGGWEIDPKIADLLHRHGVAETGEFRSRRITEELLAESDLVLTGTKAHRLGIGADFPSAYSRTFTMREATLLLATPEILTLPEYDATERGRAAIALLQRLRGSRALRDDELDIPDPHGRSTSAYKAMMREVAGVVDVLSFVLAPASVRLPRALR